MEMICSKHFSLLYELFKIEVAEIAQTGLNVF